MSPALLGLVLTLLTPPTAKEELAKLQGRWTVAQSNLPPDFVKQAKILIEGDRFVLASGDQSSELRITLDPSKEPKEIDLAKGSRTALGIYLLDGDRLKLCYEVQGGMTRPRKFALESGTEILMNLERKK